MWKMRIGEHLLQDDQSISVDFSPILAAHKIFEKKKMGIFAKKDTRVDSRKEKNSSVPSINFSAALVVACLRPGGY